MRDVMRIADSAVCLTSAARLSIEGFPGLSRSHLFRPEETGLQAFLLEDLSEDPVIRPHFHTVNQFQVFVRGDGAIGKHKLQPVSVHYADAYSPYGPIVGGKSGIAFFTLRAEADRPPFLNFMPESKDRMTCKAGRNLAADYRVVPGRAAGSAKLLDGAAGLHAGVVAAGAGECFTTLAPNTGGGQYHLVLDGSVRIEGHTLAALSCIAVWPEDDAPAYVAGNSGAQVLVVQFPGLSPGFGVAAEPSALTVPGR